MTDRSVPDMKLRLPPDLRQKVEAAAKAKDRSLNGEIVARLKASFDGPSEPEKRIEILEAELENLRAEVRGLGSRVFHLEKAD